MHYVFLKEKKITKFKTLSNNKYNYINLENITYFINYTLLENNHIILKNCLGLILISLIYYFHFSLNKKINRQFFLRITRVCN